MEVATKLSVDEEMVDSTMMDWVVSMTAKVVMEPVTP